MGTRLCWESWAHRDQGPSPRLDLYADRRQAREHLSAWLVRKQRDGYRLPKRSESPQLSSHQAQLDVLTSRTAL